MLVRTLSSFPRFSAAPHACTLATLIGSVLPCHASEPPKQHAESDTQTQTFEIADPSQLGGVIRVVGDESQPGAPVRSMVPGVGSPGPELTIDGVLEGVTSLRATDASLATWKGKAVVLEFTAGWCGPCRATAPHMNELVEVFRDDNRIAFLAITNEDEEMARAFRDAVEMVPPLAYDTDGSTWEAYGVKGVPAVVLIDKHGSIVAKGHPAFLDRDLLERFAKGEAITLEGGHFEEGEPDAYPVNWNMGGMSLDPEGIARMLEAQKAAERIEGVEDAVAFTLLRPATKRQSFRIGGMDGEVEHEV